MPLNNAKQRSGNAEQGLQNPPEQGLKEGFVGIFQGTTQYSKKDIESVRFVQIMAMNSTKGKKPCLTRR